MAGSTVRLLIIDNFDSFVYNLAQGFGALGAEVEVVRNDVGLDTLECIDPDAVIVSPGPGSPGDAGVSVAAIRAFAPRVPVLGVCLGHQCIGAAYGARISRAAVGPRHGKTSPVSHNGRGVFAGLPSPFVATRYHSLEVHALPPELEATAHSDDGVVMGLAHRELSVEGVQFHPESVLTTQGPRLLANFLDAARAGLEVGEQRSAPLRAPGRGAAPPLHAEQVLGEEERQQREPGEDHQRPEHVEQRS